MLGASDGPIILALAVTPSDSTVFTNVTRGLYVGTGGDVNVQFGIPQPTDTVNNYSNTNSYANAVFKNVAAGSVLPIRVNKVFLTSTGASNILALY